jgi:hypothetical protein
MPSGRSPDHSKSSTMSAATPIASLSPPPAVNGRGQATCKVRLVVAAKGIRRLAELVALATSAPLLVFRS